MNLLNSVSFGSNMFMFGCFLDGMKYDHVVEVCVKMWCICLEYLRKRLEEITKDFS